MKKFLVLISVLFVANFAASAQDYEAKYGPQYQECMKYLSFYQEAFKAKDYKLALDSWRVAYKICKPTCSENMYIQGATMYRKEISTCKDAALKAALIDTLLAVQDARAEYFPKKAVAAINTKNQDIVNYFKNTDPERTYREVVPSVVNVTKAGTSLPVIDNSFDVACKLYGEGKVGAEELINLYEQYIAILGEIAQTSKTPEQVEKTVTNVEGLFIESKAASCDNLIALFTPRVKEAPEDVELAKNVVKIMSKTDDCMNNDLFLNSVSLMYKTEPSHESAWFLYRLHSSRGEVKEATKRLQEAIDFEESGTADDAKYNLELAKYSYKNDNLPLALKAANLAINQDPELAGQAYYIISSVWIASKCPGDEVKEKAKYWVAVDYLTKAKGVDASLAEDCDNKIKEYKKHFPSVETAFMYDILEGQSYTLNCAGMSATTVVRLQK